MIRRSETCVRNLEQGGPPTDKERASAKRALKKMSEENPDLRPTQHLTNLFVALRRTMPGGSRITARCIAD